jgi:hypothetical protein
MDHLRFKSNHTAAVYAADGLDAQTQEAFELHMMSCPECTGDVEVWRAMRSHLPRDDSRTQMPSRPETVPAAVAAPAHASVSRWRIAATVAAVGMVGAIAGWYARSAQGPWADSARIAFVSLPPATRSLSDCTPLQVESQTRLVALRIPGAAVDEQLVAIDSTGHDMSLDRYAVSMQGDESWLVRFPADELRNGNIRFETRSVDGTAEPLGCVAGAGASE